METVQNQILDELATRKLQQERIFKYKAKGTIIFLTAHWYIDRGKYTKYFLNLEHLHFNKNKNLSKAYMYSRQNDNSVVKKDKIYTSAVTPINDLYDDRFFPKIHLCLLQTSNYVQRNGLLSVTQRKGLIISSVVLFDYL